MTRAGHWAARTGTALALWAAALPALADPAKLSLGRALFQKGAAPPCAVCHMLKDAGSEGAVGPSLDEIKPDAQRVATALRNGVGSMPAFKDTLTPAQIDALAFYVSTVAGK